MIGRVTLLVVLCGCLSAPDPDPARVPLVTLPEPTVTPFIMDGCSGNAMFLLVAPSTVLPHLPGGFQARDAAGLFDSVDATTGQGAVFVATMTCDESSSDLTEGGHAYGFVAIFVEDPSVDSSHVDQPSRYDFYMPGMLVQAPDLLTRLEAWDWPVEDAEVTVANTIIRPDEGNLTGQGGRYVGQGHAEVTTNVSYIYDVPAPVPGERNGLILPLDGLLMRVWTQADSGLGALEFRFSHDVPLAPLSTCTFPPGSLPERVLNQTNCTQKEPNGPEALLGDRQAGALFDDLDAEARLIWLPGVRA